MGIASSTARKVLSPTAVALGATVPSEDAEGAYIPLKAFAETGSEVAKALYKKAKKAISDGADEDELYRKYGVYRSEDGQYKVDVPEIKARNREYAEAVTTFIDKAKPLMNRQRGGAKSVGTMGDFLPKDSPIFEYFPELRDVEVNIVTPTRPKNKKDDKGTPLGHFIPSKNKIEIFVPNQKSLDGYEVRTEDDQLHRAWVGFGTLVHEFQHYLQHNKGSLNSGFNTFRGAVNKREVDKEIADLKEQIAQAESMPDVMSNPEYAKNVEEMKDQLRRMENAFAGPSEIYVRVLGELEAESTAMKAGMTRDERLKVGVFYPQMRNAFFPNAESTEKAMERGAIKGVPKDEVLVRTEDEHSLDFAGDKIDRVVLADDPRAKTSKGFVDLPSSGVAGAITAKTGFDMAKEYNVADELGIPESVTTAADRFLRRKAPLAAAIMGPSEDVEISGKDVLESTPVAGEVLLASDLLGMLGDISQMEEGEEQPEAIDEFTGVEEEYGFASPAPSTEPEVEEMKKEKQPDTFACGGSVSKKEKGAMDGGIMSVSIEEVPAGALPEEVADDVPAMLSEGEYVVPADVVRWHGLKSLEGLRMEAKMGLGMMDADGRIKGYDKDEGEEDMPEDGGIEDNDYAKEEEGIMAADGGVVTNSKPSFYRYTSKLNPDTGRYEFVPVAVDTNQVVSPDQFDPARGTRYGIQTQLGEIYKGVKDCGEGFVWDEESQSCVAVAEEGPNLEQGQASVTTASSGEGTAIMGPSEVQYADQATTKIAEFLGPLSAEQLKDQEGDLLADKAVNRMFQETDVEPLGIKDIFSPIGAIIKSVTRASDAVGAKRAAITRSNEFTDAAKEAAQTGKPMDLMAYNFNYNPDTASFTRSSPSTQITSLGLNADGNAYVQDWNQLGSSGTSYNLSDQKTWDNMTDDQWEDVFDQIDSDFENLSVSTGANQVTTSLNDSRAVSSSSTTSGSTYTPNFNFEVDYSSSNPTFTSTPNTTSKPAPSTSSSSSSPTTTTTTSKVTDSKGNPISDGRGGTVQGRTTTTSSSSSSSTSGGGCVIATHGVMTGGFSVREKATAELYCVKNFHGTWWGEAFRRGYRYTGNKHIAEGTAEEVYQEFKDFVKTGRGLKKDLKSRLSWAKRVVQFIVLGLTVARKD